MAVPYFDNLIKGKSATAHLSAEMPCHALFYYTLMVESSIIPNDNALVVEGMPDPYTNATNLFKSVARLYGVDDPDQLTHYWIEVNSQRRALGEARIPDKYQIGNPLLTSANAATIIMPSTGLIN